MKAIDAVSEGIPLTEAAKACEDLKIAIDAWG